MVSQWLTSSTRLVGIRNSHHLATLFLQLLKEGMQLSDSLLLLPSTDGRYLESHERDDKFCWSVVDFDTPFAHVLQSGQPMALTADEMVFWRSNRSFSLLGEQVGMFDQLRLQPLPMQGDQVQSMLVLVGDKERLNQAFNDEQFAVFLEVFIQQWSLLSEMQNKEQTRLTMKDSLSDMEQVTEQQSRLNQLSNRLIGDSQVMHKLRKQILAAASSGLSVMVQGETGTGKELVAEAIHAFSARNQQPFVALNCAAIPEHLLESELFGYCKGAFSGADSDKQGLIAQADGGTLFLDEIGDMPLMLQAKLLRVLEAKTFRPLGGKQEFKSDFRLVSATHVNLHERVKSKQFRQDLYYRLLQYPIRLPRLAERVEDLVSLCEFFISDYNQQNGTYIRGIHYRAIDALEQYDFPGNVRELKHLIEFSCVQTKDNTEIHLESFSSRLEMFGEAISSIGSEQGSTSTLNRPVVDDLKQAVNDFEAQIITERLARFDGDRAKTAESLGIPKRTLAYKCQKLEIEA